jgi:hypothetical protein
MDVLLNKLEERANFKKDRQALQDSMNTSRNSSLVVHKSGPTQEKYLQPRLTYAGKYTGNNSKRPSLRELIEEQDKITNNLSKKLVANDKILEDISVKMDNFSEILKDQAIFNAKLESKLSKLSVVAPVATNLEHVFNVRTRGGKQTIDPPYPKGTTRPLSRTPTPPATSVVPVAPAKSPEKDNDVEEVVQEEQDSARQDFHDTNFIPYPRRVRNPQVDDQFGKFIEVIQKLYVNIPLLDVMQVPTYAKYIRDILNKKKPLPTTKIIKLTEECSAAILNTSLIKKKDPGCPTIECSIGNQYFNNALCDLGASVSVMPKVVFDKLKHPTLVPTSMCLQLADQSVRYPSGITENVLVKI